MFYAQNDNSNSNPATLRDNTRPLHTPTHCTYTEHQIPLFFCGFGQHVWEATCCPGGFRGIKATSAFWTTSLFFCPEEKSCRQKPESQTEVELFLATFIYEHRLFFFFLAEYMNVLVLKVIFLLTSGWILLPFLLLYSPTFTITPHKYSITFTCTCLPKLDMNFGI